MGALTCSKHWPPWLLSGRMEGWGGGGGGGGEAGGGRWCGGGHEAGWVDHGLQTQSWDRGLHHTPLPLPLLSGGPHHSSVTHSLYLHLISLISILLSYSQPEVSLYQVCTQLNYVGDDSIILLS